MAIPLFRLHAKCLSWYWVGRSGWKKKILKNHKKFRNRRPWYPRTALKVNNQIFGLSNCTINCKDCSCFCSYFSQCSVTMLTFQIKRIISSEKWVNYLVTFFFFLKMPKIWVGWTTANIEKKEDGLTLKYRLGAIELGNDLFKNLVTGFF